jgi:hypothetical protein
MRIKLLATSLFFSLVLSSAIAQSGAEPDWRGPLAGGGAPECPDHTGMRTLRSETVRMGTTRAYIEGTSVRGMKKSCQSNTRLFFAGPHRHSLPLASSQMPSYSIADFSPDGSRLLLEAGQPLTGPPYENYRNVSVAVVSLSDHEIHWVNVWDLFHWGHCEATVEAQGFTAEGQVLLRVRPSNLNPPAKNDCVHRAALYATNLQSAPAEQPSGVKVARFGREVTPQLQACKSDPDIVDACFTVHGRMSAWNGSPTLRIWRAGTNRILGDHDDWPLPEALARQMDWEVEAWGDFEVCPFTKEKPGVMQMVCVESATNVTYKKR